MNDYFKRFSVTVLLCAGSAIADQPIMNMMPRWDGGYGFQVLYGTESGDDVLDGTDKVSNPLGREFTVDTLDIEGVYTWTRSIRFTFKQPWVIHQSRTVERDGKVVRETGSGLDDLTLNLPLKYYFNKVGYSGNITLSPHLKVPTGDDGDAYPVADNSWDAGASMGYEVESTEFFLGFGVGVWWNGGEDGNRREIHTHVDVGYNVSQALTVYWEMDPEWHEGRGDSPDRFVLQAGPAVYYRMNDMVHTRIEYKTPLYEDVDGVALTDGSEIKFGVGGVW